jgi:hypothetical protein
MFGFSCEEFQTPFASKPGDCNDTNPTWANLAPGGTKEFQTLLKRRLQGITTQQGLRLFSEKSDTAARTTEAESKTLR